jgi:hypothetical protein
MPSKPQGAFGKNIASIQMRDILTPEEAHKNISLAKPRMSQANCECKNCGGDEIEVHALFLSHNKTPNARINRARTNRPKKLVHHESRAIRAPVE